MLIRLGANGLVDLLQQCVGAATKSIIGNKPLGGSYRKRHCHKPWFDTNCCIAKRELRLSLKANPNSHVAKHQESKLKTLLKRKRILWETVRAQHMCALAKVDVLSFWKKYQPRAPIVDKINVATFLEGFCRLAGQFPPPIWLRIDHSAQVTKPPPSHTLNTDITLTELLQAPKKLQTKEQGY